MALRIERARGPKENSMRHTLGALFIAFFAMGVGAQTIYKSIMPDGKVIYGEKAAAGAKKVETIEAPPATTGVTAVTPEERARAAQEPTRSPVPPARTQETQEARLALKNAEAAREAGREPLSSERMGNVGGGSRLTEAYFARQKSLEEAVAAARRRVEEASR
jgi:hypothetical protein